MTTSNRTATHQLVIEGLFDGLTHREKLYAHYLARAAWYGSRIILRQTSPEGTGIFDFILELHKACKGQWNKLVDQYGGEGDRKVVPHLSAEALRKMAGISPDAATALDKIIDPLLSNSPFSLGFPDGNSQSNYYPGEEQITKEDIAAVAKVMEKHSIEPENTRVLKITDGTKPTFEILQASAVTSTITDHLDGDELETTIRVKRGDHATDMSNICSALAEAVKHATSAKQASLLSEYIESFSTGSLEAYRKSQKTWVTDISPRVESILGFVEPYRDPYGVRAEWEGAICISDPDETNKLKELVDNSTKFIRMLPWAVPGENDGKGPFEANRFQAPDFTIVHALAFCTSTIWEAVNLPNYSDIRETCGLKNIVFANRMSANNNPSRPCHYVHASDFKSFRGCNHIIRFIVTAIHELLGHGTGKLLTETASGTYNFERDNLPVNPLTGKAIETWYKPGQTWTSVFEKLATSVEECRAMLVSYYFVENKEMLSMFGYDDSSAISADDLIYYAYLAPTGAAPRRQDKIGARASRYRFSGSHVF
ncbi:dipeptidyl peptidase III, partial [Metarhizium majus ARSEF 297]